MGIRVQHNIMAMNAYRNYTNNTNALSKNLEKLSSGYKINRAGDDAAGLAVSEKMRAQIQGLNAAQKNVKDGTSLIKTAEGAMQEVQDMLNRMVYLATESANGTYDNDVDRMNLQKEVASLKTEINRIADSSNFNGLKLMDGSLGGATVNAVVGKAGTTAAGGKASSMSIDFTGASGASAIGGKIEIGEAGADGKYQIVKTGATAEDGYTAINVAEDADDAAIATAVKTAIGGVFSTNYDVSISDNTIIKIADKAANDGSAADKAFKGPIAAVNVSNMGLTLQIGDTADSYNQMKVSIGNMHTDSLGIDDVDISTLVGSQEAIDKIKAAINTVSSTRGDLGALQNRLDHTLNNLSVMSENITDAESNIRDTDVAEEMMSYTKNNILIQSAQAMLAQANQVPQGVLQLLQ